ncbi:coiled-coil-helix-coiled-coil-helix domain-containing protein 1-like [Brienomyrus brachyistius]|uniref:coiled-coil-helix-coiled-coil-helix domain-containing protein 1-like n=1 Tax=Brienomyrus brachyistius TaxID=42636 RepID=UPI0020B20601|nr:coiled-coil-helix-coiled-coil-helix domain-containing protein 1-like [Brienomyrus brachyistius]
MSSQGIALQQKLSRMLSKTVGKPVLKPNKPLALKDEVANRKMKKGEATCIMEMSLLMACWKEHEFNDALYSSEVQAFFKCAEKAEAARKAKADGTVGQHGVLYPKQANTLLKRYPNHFKEI